MKKKTLKCPLCDGLFVLNNNLFQKIPVGSCYCLTTRVYIYKCSVCHLAAKYGETPKQARYYAEELISKFPPIMRLGQGDNVMVRFSDDTHTVLYTNVDRGKIYLQDVYGNALPYDVDEIKQWPWELEQKGGSNDI